MWPAVICIRKAPSLLNAFTNYNTGLEFKQYAFRPILHVLRQRAMGAAEPQ